MCTSSSHWPHFLMFSPTVWHPLILPSFLKLAKCQVDESKLKCRDLGLQSSRGWSIEKKGFSHLSAEEALLHTLLMEEHLSPNLRNSQALWTQNYRLKHELPIGWAFCMEPLTLYKELLAALNAYTVQCYLELYHWVNNMLKHGLPWSNDQGLVWVLFFVPPPSIPTQVSRWPFKRKEDWIIWKSETNPKIQT